MLVLARKIGEHLNIRRCDELIRITVVRIGDEKVRIGVDAPIEWNIARDENDWFREADSQESQP